MSASGQRAVIALGSNLGDREATLRAAVGALRALDGVHLLGVSGLVESHALKPEGVDEAAPNYLNAMVIAEVTLSPLQLLDALNAIERDFGRIRDTVWGDRTLDLDLISVGVVEQQSERLTLPHPRAWERVFVLAPWAQLDPEAVIPGRGTVAGLLAEAEGTVWDFPAEPLFSPPHTGLAGHR